MTQRITFYLINRW